MYITFFVDLFKSLNFSLKLFSLKSIFSEIQGKTFFNFGKGWGQNGADAPKIPLVHFLISLKRRSVQNFNPIGGMGFSEVYPKKHSCFSKKNM